MYSSSARLVKLAAEEVSVNKPMFIYKKSCSTCRKARSFLVEQAGAGAFDERDMSASPLAEREIEALIGKRDYIPFLNTRNELYREKKMKQNPPSRAEALKHRPAP